MKSRHLFIKPRSAFPGRWLVPALLLLGLFLFFRTPQQQSLDDFPWQPPIEPKGLGEAESSPLPAAMPASAAAHKTPETSHAAASAPVDSTPLSPAPVANQDSDTSGNDPSLLVRETLARWSHAWSARDVATYLDTYARTFTPEGGASRSAWEQMRKQRILSKQAITHEIRNLKITVEGEKATARFEQIYVADNLRSVGPKTLQLERIGTEWLIVSENTH